MCNWDITVARSCKVQLLIMGNKPSLRLAGFYCETENIGPQMSMDWGDGTGQDLEKASMA